MGATIGLTFLMIVAVNYLGAKNLKTFDFSSSQINSLSDQSRKVLKNLKYDLRVLYFYQRGAEGVEENKKSFIEVLKKYTDESSKVKLEFVEMNENPQLTEEFAVKKGSGLVFVSYDNKKSRIEKIDEQEITGAIVKVTRELNKKIYFTVGHGERSLDEEQEPTGLSALKKLFESNRYNVAPLSLVSGSDIPADADAVVIAGPEQDFLGQEIQAIERYLERGGSLWVLLKPQKDIGLGALLSKIGVRVGTEYIAQIMDSPIGKTVNPQVTPVSGFNPDHVMTRPFLRTDLVLMRLPAVVVRDQEIPGLEYTELAYSDPQSMAFIDKTFKGEGKPGPFPIMATVSGDFPSENKTSSGGAAGTVSGETKKDSNLNSKNKMQVLVVGDVDFIANQLLYKNLNRDLALNAIAYLAREENMISITPKEVAITDLKMTPTQFYIFIFGFILPLPLLLLGTSGFLWYRRRSA